MVTKRRRSKSRAKPTTGSARGGRAGKGASVPAPRPRHISDLIAEAFKLREAAELLGVAPLHMRHPISKEPVPGADAVRHARFVAKRFLGLTVNTQIDHRKSL